MSCLIFRRVAGPCLAGLSCPPSRRELCLPAGAPACDPCLSAVVLSLASSCADLSPRLGGQPAPVHTELTRGLGQRSCSGAGLCSLGLLLLQLTPHLLSPAAPSLCCLDRAGGNALAERHQILSLSQKRLLSSSCPSPPGLPAQGPWVCLCHTPQDSMRQGHRRVHTRSHGDHSGPCGGASVFSPCC